MVRVASENKYKDVEAHEAKPDIKNDHNIQPSKQSNRMGENDAEVKSRTSSRRSMDNK
jgi:hypothetical protein